MAHIDAFDKEKNVLGNVGGVIGNSLQIVRDKNQIEGGVSYKFGP